MHFLESKLLILVGLYVLNDRLVNTRLPITDYRFELLLKESVLYDSLIILSVLYESVW